MVRIDGPTARCFLCPQCGAWVVIQKDTATRLDERGNLTSESLVTCPNPKCVRPQFRVKDEDTTEFTISLDMFLSGFFYPPELWL